MDINKNFDDNEARYDESGYLIPIEKSQELEENDYEPPPAEKIITNFAPFRPQVQINKSIAERAPLALPRDSTDALGYIQGPTQRMSQFEPPEKKSSSFRSRAKPPSPEPSSHSLNNETEDAVEETYEPPPNVVDNDSGRSFLRSKSSSPSSESVTSDKSEGGTLSKKFLGLLKNPLGRKNTQVDINSSEQSGRKGSISIKPQISRDKSPSYSANSLDRKTSITSRPLPPLPTSGTHEPTEIYENLKNELKPVRTPSPEVEYSNQEIIEDEPPKLPEKDLSLHIHPRLKGAIPRKTQKQEVQVPLRNPESYELYHSQKRLPIPPDSLPQIPFSPMGHDADDEDDGLQEYNNAIFNLNDEPFYRNTDRKGAKLLLQDFDDGAFLFRPSKKFFLTLSLKYHGKYFNLGVERSETNKIRLNTDGDSMSPEFATIGDFIRHFTREYLTFQHEGQIVEVLLEKKLPHNRF